MEARSMEPDETAADRWDQGERLSALASLATALGFEIVDIAGFLDRMDDASAEQLMVLPSVRGEAGRVMVANGAVQEAVLAVVDKTSLTLGTVEGSVEYVRRAGKLPKAVENNNAEIARIASQVNILATDAKIEASRAGDAGRGFAVDADAINALSRQTSNAARSRGRCQGIAPVLLRARLWRTASAADLCQPCRLAGDGWRDCACDVEHCGEAPAGHVKGREAP
jgi:methyl-accepting chemotaxis protein